MLLTDKIIWLLRDGKWHNVKEIMQFSPCTKYQTLTVLLFLCKFGFIEMDENQVRLHSLTLKFIKNIEIAEMRAQAPKIT
jgi:hypothetical protein